MSRFTNIIANLHLARSAVLQESRQRRRTGGSAKPKAPKKLSFDSPELEAIFNALPKDMQDLVKKGE